MGIKALIVVCALFPAFVFAYTNPGVPTGHVNDFAGTLSASDRASLEQKLASFNTQTGNEIAIAIIKNLEGDTVENFAVKLFEDWGIGKKGKDNGVLVLVSMDEHKIRIEVGYGLEEVLTDAQSFWIIDDVMKPAFRDGKYYEGLDMATDKIIAAIGGETLPVTANNTIDKNLWASVVYGGITLTIWISSLLARSKSWWGGGVVGAMIGAVVGFFYGFMYVGIISILILFLIGLLLDLAVSRAYQKGVQSGRPPAWWAGGRRFGGGSGGFGGFGGGGSGGGGASGGW